MNITSAKYVKDLVTEEILYVDATIEGQTMTVPIDLDNRHYAAILEWAEEDGNTIEEAD